MDKNIINEIKNMKYFLDYKRGVVVSEQTASSTENQTASTETTPATPIKIGVKNSSIEELQNLLNTNFQSNLNADGKYGPKTSSSILVALQNKMKSTNEPPSSTETTGASTAAEKTAAANTSQPLASNTENNQQQPQEANNFSEVDLNSIIKVG